MTSDNYQICDLELKIRNSLNLLLEKDLYLITNDLNERTVCSKLSQYIFNEFSNWDIDIEFNRMHELEKKIYVSKNKINLKNIANKFLKNSQDNEDELFQLVVITDIIIHKRNTNDNLLVIEVKKKKNVRKINKEFDYFKLDNFVDRNGNLNYKYGLYLEINSEIKNGKFDDYFKMKWFVKE